MRHFLAIILMFVSIQTFSNTFSVITTNDNGSGSLRSAITLSNNNPGKDTIAFNLSGNGPFTIYLLSTLPPIEDELLIDGFSQPNSFPANLLVQINGSLLPNTASFDNCWKIHSSNVSIQGLVIEDFNFFNGYTIGNRVAAIGVFNVLDSSNISISNINITQNEFTNNSCALSVFCNSESSNDTISQINISENLFTDHLLGSIYLNISANSSTSTTSNITIEQNSFNNDSLSSILIESQTIYNADNQLRNYTIRGNSIRGVQANGSTGVQIDLTGSGNVNQNLSGWVIDSNNISGFQNGVKFNSAILLPATCTMSDNKITNNRIYDCNNGLGFLTGPLGFLPSSSNLSFRIINNQVIGQLTGTGVQFKNISSGCTNSIITKVKITNNEIIDFDKGIEVFTGGPGSQLGVYNTFQIDSNKIYGNLEDGLHLSVGSSTGQTQKIKNFQVRSNHFKGNSRGIYIYGFKSGTGETVLNNILIEENEINESFGLGIQISLQEFSTTIPLDYDKITIRHNQIYENGIGGLRLDFALLNLNSYAPIFDSVIKRNDSIITFLGLYGEPNQTYIIDYYGNHGTQQECNYEGKFYLGSDTLDTDNSGCGAISSILFDTLNCEWLTATATNMITYNTTSLSKAETINLIVGVEEMNIPLINSIYPNPVSSTLNIEGISSLPADIKVFDLNGVLVYETSVHSKNASLDFSGIAPGHYLLIIDSKSCRASYQVIKI